MAIVKHIKSKNANYTDAINYLFYQHDEKTKTLLLNEYGQPMLREEFYEDGLNCTPETFDLDCSGTNRTFNKNRRNQKPSLYHQLRSQGCIRLRSYRGKGSGVIFRGSSKNVSGTSGSCGYTY